MKYQQTVFGQLLTLVPREIFQKLVEKYNGDYKTHKLDCWTQFVTMFYAQLKQRNSLRDIETGLEVQCNKLYHLGMIQPIKRSTLSDANNKRSYHIYEETFNYLLNRCQTTQRGRKSFKNPIQSIDSTTIELCHSLYPWTKYRVKKGGIKLHMKLDHDTDLPDFLCVTDANTSDLAVGKSINFKPDSILIFDRGYYDFNWFYTLHKQGIIFVSRVKKNFTYQKIGQHKIEEETNIISDEDVFIPGPTSHRKRCYLDPIRLVTYQDPENGEIIRFLTNSENFNPKTIVEIYKQRWKIETFFKWIKQHLKIKSFLGTSKNAVMSQIWIAMIVYLVIWYLKQQVQYSAPLIKLSRILNESLFERLHLLEILGKRRAIIFNSLQLSLGFT